MHRGISWMAFSYACGPLRNTGNSQLTINTQDGNDSALSGYYTALFQNGSVVGTGFSPTVFTLNDGQIYVVQVDDYGSYHFDHWQDTGGTTSGKWNARA